MNILVVAAHPDDEVLGCGGTIAKMANEGHSVHICILGEGMTSRVGASKEEVKALHAHAQNAAEILGASDVTLHKLTDNRFDTLPLLDITKIVEQHIETIRPEEVYTQHGGDLNIDHVCTFRAVLTATRPMEKSPVKKVYAYEVMSSTEWAFQQFAPIFVPNVFVDISTTLQKKIEAMQAYKTESREFPHPRSSKNLEACATRWGSVAGCNAAEAFQLIQERR